MFAAIMVYLARIRPAFSRATAFHWFALLVIGIALSNDQLGGISPAVRALAGNLAIYDAFRHVLHSRALDLAKLSNCWGAALVNIFGERIVRTDGRRTFIVDAINNPKEGRRMPGVKKMHQETSSNSKPEIIRGHFIQVVGVLVEGIGTFFCLPFFGRIHDGFRLKADDTRTQKDRIAEALLSLPLLANGLLLGDCWYACKPIINALPVEFNLVLLSRVAKNAVANAIPLPDFARPPKRGKKPKYGLKLKLATLFAEAMTTAAIPDGRGGLVEVKYWHRDLLWRPLKKLVRFVGCDHPIKGRIVLISTNIAMPPLEMIIGYSRRFRIEVTFKTAVYSIGTFCYRLWSKSIDKMPRFPTSEDLTNKPTEYVEAFMRKIHAYEASIMAGFIAQGLLVMLSLLHTELVQGSLKTWFRTIRPNVSLSETVVAASLRTCVAELRDGSAGSCALANFVAETLRNSPEQGEKCAPSAQSS
jgi:hypothetical protein